MLEILQNTITGLNSVLWGAPMIILLLAHICL